ncbi:MAG: 2-hydroxy-6-oxononadienedioate/2-hydroxy-6-oxononatrienedioate hydrolase [Betaproteobacteria bacterium ADurb.Bin341]|nr:MAG: 2-hydroxy-6-oxononadienedioate/2-hydroxy-6-oxononatrienedioate hydrolase [Betaproteobacteria bacterium ADurb.Bin341]
MEKLHCDYYDFSLPWIKDKVPLVLIHGHGADGHSWFPQIPDFSKHFPVIVVDLPGCGKTPEPAGRITIEALAEAVHDSIRGLYTDKINVMGISLGGYVSIEFAARYADEVEKLVLLGTPHDFSPEIKDIFRATMKQYEQMSMEEIVVPKIDRAFGKLAPPEMRKFLVDDILKTAHSAYLRIGQAPIDYNPVPRYPHIRARTMIIAGELDHLGGPEEAVKLQAALPGAEVLVLKDTGHALNLENPEGMNQKTIDFLLARNAS